MPIKPSSISYSVFSSSVLGFFTNGGFLGFCLSFEVEFSVNLPKDVSFLATAGLSKPLDPLFGFAVLGLADLVISAAFYFMAVLFGGDFGALWPFLAPAGFGYAAAALAENTGFGRDCFTRGSCFCGAVFLMAGVDLLG